MRVAFTPSFLNQLSKLESDLREEVISKIELFKDKKNHKQLKTHKLKGRLAGRFSFSVDYKYRIVFKYFSKDEVILLSVGDHNIYR